MIAACRREERRPVTTSTHRRTHDPDRCAHRAAPDRRDARTFRRPSPAVRPRQPVLPGGLRRTACLRLPVGTAPRRPGRIRTRSGRRQPAATTPRLRRAGDRNRREHAPLLGRPRRRPPPQWRRLLRLDPRACRRGPHLRGRSRRGRQRHSGAVVQLLGRTGRRRLGVQRPQDLRQPVAGVDLSRRPRHGHQRSDQPASRPRLLAPGRAAPSDRRDLGHARHARHAVTRHDPRPCLRARRRRPRRLPGRDRRRRAVPRRPVRLVATRLRRRLQRHRQACVRRGASRSCPPGAR